MITWFRNLLAGPGKWIFLGLVIVSFAAFGDFDLSRFSPQSALRVGDRAYSVADVDRAFSRQFRIAQAQDNTLTRQEAIQGGMLDRTLTQMQLRALIAEEADALGLTATDQMIQQYLRDSGAFDDPTTGEFSPGYVQRVIESQQMSPSEFRDELREEIVRSQLVTALGVPAPAPERLVRLLVLRTGEQRTVRTATVTADDAPAPDEEALRSYYASNADDYRSRETRRYRALVIDEEAVASRVEVPDADVRQYFESRQAELGEPERRTFRQALFRDEAQAETAAERVRAGETLQAVAEELGASTTRSADQQRAGILDADLAEAVFGLEEPGIVGPVRGTFGIIVAEVESITPGTEVTFEDVEEELREGRRAELVRSELFTAVEEAEQAFDGGATLDEAAQATGLPAPRSFGPVDADLITPEGAVEAVPGAVHRSAFALGEGDESGAIPLDDGGYAFLVVDEIQPASTLPYEAVAERVAADFEESRRGDALDAAVAAIESAVAGGQSFEDAAAAAGSEVETLTISARAPSPDLPQSLLPEIFDARIGEVVSSSAPGSGTATVAIVDDVTFEGDPNVDALMGTYQDQFGEQIANEFVETYVRALGDEYGVERNAALIDQQFGQAE